MCLELILQPRYSILPKNAGSCPSFFFSKTLSKAEIFLFSILLQISSSITSTMIKLKDAKCSIIKGPHTEMAFLSHFLPLAWPSSMSEGIRQGLSGTTSVKGCPHHRVWLLLCVNAFYYPYLLMGLPLATYLDKCTTINIIYWILKLQAMTCLCHSLFPGRSL